ncbi:hypothetical protein [Bacillus litorisediminis]|uniref:hypothetical protein n=1 Tax=Bacillus litorisediminis TaxID=2922713 RepID=UPI001FAE94CE|nr:hypothetical protein [Bacillus litorisediminis]
MTYFLPKDIKRMNQETMERIKYLPNLYCSMVEAVKGNSRNLDNHFYSWHTLEEWKVHNKMEKKHFSYIKMVEPKLNHLLITLKKKYCSNEKISFAATYKDVFCNKKVQKNAMKNAEFCHPI